MKASRYNILVPLVSGQTLLFNSATVALAEIDPDDLADVKCVLAMPESNRTPHQEEIFQVLCDGKFLVPAEIDELHTIAARNRLQRFGGDTLFLTIAPTLGCNFACPYCFESKNSSSTMDAETERALLEFVRARIQGTKQILVTWFGGEPTLCLDLIERVQSALLRLAHEKSVSLLPASMVTNGYLLDRAAARRLKNLDITDIQITLDGPRESHDKRRTLIGGGATFDHIIANIESALDLVQITIRMNIDRSNADAALDLAHELNARGILGKANLYFAPIADAGGSCSPSHNSRWSCTAVSNAMESTTWNIPCSHPVDTVALTATIPLSSRRPVIYSSVGRKFQWIAPIRSAQFSLMTARPVNRLTETSFWPGTRSPCRPVSAVMFFPSVWGDARASR
jgi:uncharacterized protein